MFLCVVLCVAKTAMHLAEDLQQAALRLTNAVRACVLCGMIIESFRGVGYSFFLDACKGPPKRKKKLALSVSADYTKIYKKRSEKNTLGSERIGDHGHRGKVLGDWCRVSPPYEFMHELLAGGGCGSGIESQTFRLFFFFAFDSLPFSLVVFYAYAGQGVPIPVNQKNSPRREPCSQMLCRIMLTAQT